MAGSNLILDPTLALNRAELGFRIKVGAECEKMSKICGKGSGTYLSLASN